MTPAELSRIAIRRARRADVDPIMRLVNAGAPAGVHREQYQGEPPPEYFAAFDRIDRDPQCELMVAELDGAVVGTFHITYLTYLAGRGRDDAQLEAVHVAAPLRGLGVGSLMMRWAIDRARQRGCRRIQLTSNKAREDAHRFYERLGFEASHEGMKLMLAPGPVTTEPAR